MPFEKPRGLETSTRDLAAKVLLAGQLQRPQRDGAGGGVEDRLAVGCRFGEGAEPYLWMLLLPGATRPSPFCVFAFSGGVSSRSPRPPVSAKAR